MFKADNRVECGLERILIYKIGTDCFVRVEIGMVSFSKIDDFDQKVYADHEVVGGEVHVHGHLFFEEGECIRQVNENLHFRVRGKQRVVESVVL